MKMEDSFAVIRRSLEFVGPQTMANDGASSSEAVLDHTTG